jgi:hypothetical protein
MIAAEKERPVAGGENAPNSTLDERSRRCRIVAQLDIALVLEDAGGAEVVATFIPGITRRRPQGLAYLSWRSRGATLKRRRPVPWDSEKGDGRHAQFNAIKTASSTPGFELSNLDG